MSYNTFEILDGKLHLNNENSAPAEKSDIEIYLDADYNDPEYGSELIDLGENW